MAKIEDFSKAEDTIKEIDKAYDSGFHLHWITLIDSLIEQILKSYLYVILGYDLKENFDSSKVNYVRNLNMNQLLHICYFKLLISKELYENIKDFRSKRNIIIHSFILKNEKLDNIDLKVFSDLGKNCYEKTIIEFINGYKLRRISERIANEILARVEERIKKDESQKTDNQS